MDTSVALLLTDQNAGGGVPSGAVPLADPNAGGGGHTTNNATTGKGQ